MPCSAAPGDLGWESLEDSAATAVRGWRARLTARVMRGAAIADGSKPPAPVAEELADGLTETYEYYRRQGLAPDRAAESAVAEFGEPQLILAEFASVNPARRTARRLLETGPGVGACWAAALITGRAWEVALLARRIDPAGPTVRW